MPHSPITATVTVTATATATVTSPTRSAGPRPTAEGLSIAQAAERLGLTTHTLRYYERDGLMIRGVERAPSGHRVYNEADLVWLTMLTRLRQTGMPIREMKAYAELCRAGDGNEVERLELLEAHRSRVLAELAEVTAHLGAIDNKIGIYTSRLEQEGIVRTSTSPSAADHQEQRSA